MSRSFPYNADVEEVRKYTESLGYKTEETFWESPEKPMGFRVCDTDIEVSYNFTLDGHLVAFGCVVLWHELPPHVDPDKEQRSKLLYRKLYRKFR